MAYQGAEYEYETSPRKLKPEYETKQPVKKKAKQTTKKTNTQKTKAKTTTEQNKKENAKPVNQAIHKNHVKTVCYIFIAFAILFAISYRYSLITENFNKIENLKKQLSALQKENDQTEISIQNNLNLSKIEKSATELLGMKKIDESQKVYVNLPKKDYVESASEQVVVEEKNWFEELIDSILSIIK